MIDPMNACSSFFNPSKKSDPKHPAKKSKFANISKRPASPEANSSSKSPSRPTPKRISPSSPHPSQTTIGSPHSKQSSPSMQQSMSTPLRADDATHQVDQPALKPFWSPPPPPPPDKRPLFSLR